MAYTPDPRDDTNPLDTIDASTAAAEFRAFKAYVNNILKNSIQIFIGPTANIPQYWHLCDGTNGTIDLRDKFIVGAGNTYAVGATGGEATHLLTVNEIPSHGHALTDPGHVHSSNVPNGIGGAQGGSGNLMQAGNTGSSTTGISIANTGGGAAHNNLPPYYAFALIQYTGV